MDEPIGLRKQVEYVVGDWVLFTDEWPSWNRPGYVQRKIGSFGVRDKPIQYEILYRRLVPGPRMVFEDLTTLCNAGQLIKVVDSELTRSEFLTLDPHGVADRYFELYDHREN